MTDTEVIKHTWVQLPNDLRARVMAGEIIRSPSPPRPIYTMQDAHAVPANDKLDVIEFAPGPFGAVLGKWRNVVTLV